MGYHPDAQKQVIVYTSEPDGTFTIKDSSNAIVFNGNLTKTKDYHGNIVNCQGNQQCIIGDFSSFNTEGNYSVSNSTGTNTPPFIISSSIYKDNLPVFFEDPDKIKLEVT